MRYAFRAARAKGSAYPRNLGRTLLAFVGALLAGAAEPARAHEIPLALEHVQADFDGSRFRITILLDPASSPFHPDEKPAERAVLDQAIRDAVARRVWVRFDGRPQPFAVELEENPAAPGQLRIPKSATLVGDVPSGAQRLQFGALFAGSDLLLQLRTNGQSRGTVALRSGILSDPIELDSFASPLDVLRRFVRIGFAHILPLGIDHVLFMLGLFFCGMGAKALLLQVTGFTLAHTLALALAVLGLVTIPGAVVEPLIALSIVAVAFGNVHDDRFGYLRVALVVAFGLLHGLGFASVLAGQVPTSAEAFAPALIGFNLGVELGQLVVIGGAALALWGFRRRPWYQRRIAVPASLAIASIGAFWTVERCAQFFLG